MRVMEGGEGGRQGEGAREEKVGVPSSEKAGQVHKCSRGWMQLAVGLPPPREFIDAIDSNRRSQGGGSEDEGGLGRQL